MSESMMRARVEALVNSLFDSSTGIILDESIVQSLGDYVAPDTLDAPWAEGRLQDTFHPDRAKLLDFGCGGSHHRKMAEGFGYRWTGVDYLAGVAPGVAASVAAQPDVVFYDGGRLPFQDASFDVVFSMLSLQHIQDIPLSFSEIGRVLKPGGRFIGQTAALETIGDFTTFTYSPHGFKIATERGGMKLFRLWPKHDALTFILRRLLIDFISTEKGCVDPLLNPDGLLFRRIEEVARRHGLSVRDINLLKVQFSAHFVFEAVKN